MADDSDRDAPYIRPRIAVGSGLIALVCFLYVVGRPPEPIALGLLLGTAALFLGVEAGKAIFR